MKIKTIKKAPAKKTVAKEAVKCTAKKCAAKKAAVKSVTFTVHADKGKAVYVAGEFNGWDPTAKKMRRGREIHIYTPAEKREWAMMRAIDRCEESLARIFRGEVDPETEMLLQSAVQQEVLKEANRREGVLWAMYAMAGGYMTKPQRERFHAILKKMVDGVWYPSLTETWIRKGQKLKARVPEDVMLAGFDDVAIAPLMLPPLTTMHLPCEGIAEAVFNRLLNRIANPMLPSAEVHLDAALVERDSVRRRRQ